MPRLSVIVPVHGQPELLQACLRSIRTSGYTDYELIVSDDGSTDEESIRRCATAHDAYLIHCQERRGSAAARNRAASAAQGELLVFIDSDVTIREDTLALIVRAFDQNPGVDAVIGSYDSEPRYGSRVSKFRNLLHAHAHQRPGSKATTFWTGCGAMRRDRFGLLGGFRESFERPSIEDVELGLRLHREGGRILLVREIQVTHHKAWSLLGMLRTDLFARAIPWAALIHEHGLPDNLNFGWADRGAVALSALAVPLLWIAMRHGPAYWILLVLVLIAITICQSRFLKFLAEVKGFAFALSSVPLLLLYNLVCAVGLAAGLFRFECKRDRWFAPSLAIFGCLILGLQIAGGAFEAEFDGHPDEAAHFVSGLMVYDYLNTLPRENAIRWAEQYYLHYPKVAIGHWPPGFYLLEASWWLLVPPSRASVITLNALLSVLAAALFYRLAHAVAPPWAALSATLLLICTAVVQQGAAQCMAEIPCVLWGLLLTHALLRLAAKPSGSSAALAALWMICALLTKGTGACLVLAPLFALGLSGKWRAVFNSRILWPIIPVAIGGFGWYLLEAAMFHQNLTWLSGASRAPFPIVECVRDLVGYGIGCLALGGLVAAWVRRRPVAVSCAAVLASTLIVSRFLGAMTEPRHFIIIVPALLLLGVEAIAWAGTKTRFASLLVIPAVAFFPFIFYRQQPAGFASVAREVHLPTRMLVSSNESGEGPWIAAVALREDRPASVVVRASKTLSSNNWVGDNYKLVAKTSSAIGLKLDELGVATVILHTQPGVQNPPHQVLLQQLMEGSESWRECAAMGSVRAYCRAGSPGAPQQPLQIDLHQRIGRTIIEQRN